MNDDNIQQVISSKPLSDFNDLHVLKGLGEVKRQIEHAISTVAPLVVDSPPPFLQTDQTLGQQVENQNNIGNSDEAKSTIDKPKRQRKGEIIEFERPEYTLEKCLSRFMLVDGQTDIWDSVENKKIKGTAFTKMVGKAVASKWQSDANRKMIDESEIAKDLIHRYIMLESTQEAWDMVEHERVKLVAVRDAHPNFYDIWYRSYQRRMIHVRHLVFDPTEQAQSPEINTFTGMEIEPLYIDGQKYLSMSEAMEKCKPFVDLLKHLCSDETEAYSWLVRWLAYPLQYKGAKMASSVLMHGNIHGAGKSLFFGGVMSKIYRKYHITLDQRDLDSSYNEQMEQKLFLLFEEISNNKTKHGMMGFIKNLITGSTLSIHKKFLAAMSQANHMNTVFLSNNQQPLPIEEKDRRFLVIYPKKELSGELLQQVVNALHSQEAIEAFYTMLLQVDFKGFHAHTHPPMTKAKREIIAYTLPGYDTFITEWKSGQLEYPFCTCTANQLYDAYCKWSKRTNEHIVSQRRFMGEAKKYNISSTEAQEHWRIGSKKGQNKLVVVTEVPAGQLKQDWHGKFIEQFDKALHGVGDDVPYPKF